MEHLTHRRRSPWVAGRPAWRAADLDGDGKLDLAVTNLFEDNLTILKNQGSMSFTAQATKPNAGTGPYYIVATDIDGNDTLDLVVTNSTDPAPCRAAEQRHRAVQPAGELWRGRLP